MDLKESIHTAPITQVDLSYYVETEHGTRAGDVVEKMKASHRKCALVMRHGRLIGIFTERDIMKKVAGNPDSGNAPIDDLMTPGPETIDADMNILDATRVIASNRYRYMPVTNREGKVLGTLTYYAIIKYICDYFPQEIYNQPPVPDVFAKARAGA
ncbi:MAG: CBS domain-containing protein [Gemmatimonadota bacterium]|nr:CBS domain-containing protein [Gemmatimonadota bacterium]